MTENRLTQPREGRPFDLPARRNVFVLCTGRSGSMGFARACSHFTNYTAGHETRSRELGDQRLAYPEGHIEIDNRLAWFLGRLEQTFGDDAVYVHLTRDPEAVARSYNTRWDYSHGIVSAYAAGITLARELGLDQSRDMVRTINENIAAFLKTKSRVLRLNIETITEDFRAFADAIRAEGDIEAALAEFAAVHNASAGSQRHDLDGMAVDTISVLRDIQAVVAKQKRIIKQQRRQLAGRGKLAIWLRRLRPSAAAPQQREQATIGRCPNAGSISRRIAGAEKPEDLLAKLRRPYDALHMAAWPWPQSARLQLARGWAKLHEYERALDVLQGKSLPATLATELAAFAHLQRGEEVRGLIRRCESAPQLRSKDLFTLFLYASSYDTAAAERLRTRLMHPAVLGSLEFRQVLRLAHDASAARRQEELQDLLEVLEKADPTPEHESNIILLRSQIAFDGNQLADQAEHIARFLDKQDLQGVSIAEPLKGLSAENMMSRLPAATVAGPLVTVIMTAHNAGGTIDYALASICGQTYQNLEILVVDDCSGDGTVDIIQRHQKADSRIRLLHTPRNAGTYVAKNLALAQARGHFVTCQDSDDWALPQKIQLLSKRLQQETSIIATQSQYVRCNASHGLVMRGASAYTGIDGTSLMFRRTPVMDNMGFYDEVRAAADSEFQLRMARVFGRGCAANIGKTLNIVAWSDASLSGGSKLIDLKSGVLNHNRLAYRRAYYAWHATAKNLRLPQNPNHRPFPAPKEYLP